MNQNTALRLDGSHRRLFSSRPHMWMSLGLSACAIHSLLRGHGFVCTGRLWEAVTSHTGEARTEVLAEALPTWQSLGREWPCVSTLPCSCTFPQGCSGTVTAYGTKPSQPVLAGCICAVRSFSPCSLQTANCRPQKPRAWLRRS